MARNYDGASHRSTQELFASLTFNDYQKGFFGKLETGVGFYGLTGLYADVELGYRFTDVMLRGNTGVDMEISTGGFGKKVLGVALVVGAVLGVRALYKKVIKPKLIAKKEAKKELDETVVTVTEEDSE